MAIDHKDTETVTLQLRRKPGRKPKLKSGAMSSSERKAAERAKRKARGEVQAWLSPDELKIVEQYRSGTLCSPVDDNSKVLELQEGNDALNFKLSIVRNAVGILRSSCICGAFDKHWPVGSNLIDAMYRDRVNRMDWDI